MFCVGITKKFSSSFITNLTQYIYSYKVANQKVDFFYYCFVLCFIYFSETLRKSKYMYIWKRNNLTIKRNNKKKINSAPKKNFHFIEHFFFYYIIKRKYTYNFNETYKNIHNTLKKLYSSLAVLFD